MDHYYRRSPRIASRVVGGEAILIKMPESRFIHLNPPASRIWVGADGTHSGAELAKRSDVGDARSFFDEMVGMGLLERADSPAETAEAFPQEIEWPEPGPPSEAPRILASQPIEAFASDCTLGSVVCASGTIFA